MWVLLVWLLLITIGNVAPLGASHQKDSKCSYKTGSFSIWWTYDAASNDINFKTMARSESKNYWAGVFFGDDQPMDALGAFVRNERIAVMDGHVVGNGIVQMDNISNVQALTYNMLDGSFVIEFSRPLTTKDPSDVDLSRCTTFFLPYETTCRSQHTNFVKRSDMPVCEYRKGVNTVIWRPVGDNVEFLIQQNAKRGKWWTAIGVGPGMKNMKAAVAFLENGNSSKVSNGRSYVNFAIPKKIFGPYTDNTGCVPLQIAILAAQWVNKYEIRKHEVTPESIRVCGIDQCAAKKTGVSFAIESEPKLEKKDDIVITSEESAEGDVDAALKFDEKQRKCKEESSEMGTSTDMDTKIASQENDTNMEEASGEGSGEEEASGLEEGSAEVESEAGEGEPLSAEDDDEVEITEGAEVPVTVSVQTNVQGRAGDRRSSTTIAKAPTGTPLVLTKTLTKEVSKIIRSGCGKKHKDLFICESYFNNYLFEVSNWAKAHDQILEDHMWKACMLLSLVEKVPSACCTKFKTTCTSFLESLRRRM
ncbi:hypothetical protein KIN20_020319 [Parelaphostrongylus tenuis]|uniref:DOMON domain-containing protein n=1 Tax=Parelaphostrongylus tenuis TaxID=148309 RepID=A0AAD5MR30_PARTN|nr:hypothetical protein KIN20_020319 [Parelaphostrongylus tenuis]